MVAIGRNILYDVEKLVENEKYKGGDSGYGYSVFKNHGTQSSPSIYAEVIHHEKAEEMQDFYAHIIT